MIHNQIESVQTSWAPLHCHRHLLGKLLEHDLRQADPSRYRPLIARAPHLGDRLIEQIHGSVVSLDATTRSMPATPLPVVAHIVDAGDGQWIREHLMTLLDELLEDDFDNSTRLAWQAFCERLCSLVPPGPH